MLHRETLSQKKKNSEWLTTAYDFSSRGQVLVLTSEVDCTFIQDVYTDTHRNLIFKGAGEMDGSAVKSTYCSSRGPGFNSQHPHGSSQCMSVCLCLSLSLSLSLSHTHTHTGEDRQTDIGCLLSLWVLGVKQLSKLYPACTLNTQIC